MTRCRFRFRVRVSAGWTGCSSSNAAIFDSAMATIDGWIVNVALPAIERCGQHLADREW